MAAPERTLLDTGPVVALLVAEDAHSAWAHRVWGELEPPLLTCEAVLSEAQFLIARFGGNPRAVLEFVERGVINVAFGVQNEVRRLLELPVGLPKPAHVPGRCLPGLHGRAILALPSRDHRFAFPHLPPAWATTDSRVNAGGGMKRALVTKVGAASVVTR